MARKDEDETAEQVPTHELHDPRNPRGPEGFHDAAFDALVESIRAEGIVEPLIARPPDAKGRRELVAGGRRHAAARKLGLKRVPVITRSYAEQRAAVHRLLTNLVRAKLDGLSEAKALYSLHSEHGLSVEEIGRRVGLQKTAIYDSFGLLKATDAVKSAVASGKLPKAQAAMLATIQEPKEQREKLGIVLDQGLGFHETRDLVRSKARSVRRQGRPAKDAAPVFRAPGMAQRKPRPHASGAMPEDRIEALLERVERAREDGPVYGSLFLDFLAIDPGIAVGMSRGRVKAKGKVRDTKTALVGLYAWTLAHQGDTRAMRRAAYEAGRRVSWRAGGAEARRALEGSEALFKIERHDSGK